MKKLVLQKVQLISLKEKKAKKVILDPKRTIIFGKNSTGKSCLLKSIYHTFGAEPHKFHPNWKDANVINHLEFTLSGIKYSILKNGNTYTIFDSKHNPLKQFTQVSKLALFLSELFEFKIVLPNKDGEIVTPPPAYMLLPFYCDQDRSWQANWSSFTKLYLPNVKIHIINYHSGLRPNEYYETKSQITIINVEISDIEKDLRVVKNLIKNLNDKLSKIDFNIILLPVKKHRVN